MSEDSLRRGSDDSFVVHRGKNIPTLSSVIHDEPLFPARLRVNKEKQNSDTKADERGNNNIFFKYCVKSLKNLFELYGFFVIYYVLVYEKFTSCVSVDHIRHHALICINYQISLLSLLGLIFLFGV